MPVADPVRSPDDTLQVTSRHSVVKGPDGVVRERIGIRLGAAASVRIDIQSTSIVYTRGPVDLGPWTPGWHYWTWTGLKNDGTPARDGRYNVTVHATFESSGYVAQAATLALVHHGYHPGVVTTSYAAVYPRSTTVHDQTVVGLNAPEPVRATRRIRNAHGRVVLTRVSGAFTGSPHATWAARDRHHHPLPAGTYYAQWSGRDRDGFTGATKPRPIKVSARKLVHASRTVTIPPASAATWTYPPGCQGCEEHPLCGTVTPSQRFAQPGALSFRSGEDCGTSPSQWAASRHFVYEPHEAAPRAYGTVRLSAFGGPTTPGAADQGTLAVEYRTFDHFGGSSSHAVSTTTGPTAGDHTTTAPTVPFDSTSSLNQGPEVHGFEWDFRTAEGANYDVAAFTATYTFLTPKR